MLVLVLVGLWFGGCLGVWAVDGLVVCVLDFMKELYSQIERAEPATDFPVTIW